MGGGGDGCCLFVYGLKDQKPEIGDGLLNQGNSRRCDLFTAVARSLQGPQAGRRGSQIEAMRSFVFGHRFQVVDGKMNLVRPRCSDEALRSALGNTKVRKAFFTHALFKNVAFGLFDARNPFQRLNLRMAGDESA